MRGYPSRQRGRIWRKVVVTLAILVGVLLCAGRLSAGYLLERWALTTGPNGQETPATLGVPFERAEIPSGFRRLDSYIVSANPSCNDAPVLLIYHGVQETISDWVKAQRFLYNHCISSVVFDPSGSGNSSRPATMDNIRQDSVAAYAFTIRRFPRQRVYVFGHSMGNGPMLDAVPHFPSPPAGVIVASAFSSLRTQGVIRKHLLYRLLAFTLPDWWNNVQAIQKVQAPLLVVHSDTDQINPARDGQAVFTAARQPKTLSIVHGFKHNALYQNPVEEWWAPVLSFAKVRNPSR